MSTVRGTQGGDDACWLDRVCERCGAMLDDDSPHRCRPPVGDERDRSHEAPPVS
jgi:hypothetical protein